LFSEQGRTQLEKLSLAPRARRRKELLELLDQLDPKIAELTMAVEQEALRRPAVLQLMTHPGVGAISGLVYWTAPRAQRTAKLPIEIKYLGEVA
jgi:transposase